jgi:hypothetical protein
MVCREDETTNGIAEVMQNWIGTFGTTQWNSFCIYFDNEAICISSSTSNSITVVMIMAIKPHSEFILAIAWLVVLMSLIVFS